MEELVVEIESLEGSNTVALPGEVLFVTARGSQVLKHGRGKVDLSWS